MFQRTAIITGGSGEIGKAIASALYQNGMKTVIVGRSMEKLEVAATEIRGKIDSSESPLEIFSCDVCNEGSVADLFAFAGRCDLLVNCAGIAADKPTEELSGEEFSNVMNVNVLGSFLCSREAMKGMKAQNPIGGRIINVASIAAISPRPNSVAYTTSKHALLGLSRSLSIDGRSHGIAVGMIHPGNVKSDIMSPEEADRREAAEGFISSDDVSASVLHMASLPLSANVLEMTIIPTRQPLVGRG